MGIIQDLAPVVQWIELEFPKLSIQVRFLSGAPLSPAPPALRCFNSFSFFISFLLLHFLRVAVLILAASNAGSDLSSDYSWRGSTL